MLHEFPREGQWFREGEQGPIFEVIAASPEDGSVLLHFENGSVEEVSLDDLEELDLKQINSPNHWAGVHDAGCHLADDSGETDESDQPYNTDELNYTYEALNEEEEDEDQRKHR